MYNAKMIVQNFVEETDVVTRTLVIVLNVPLEGLDQNVQKSAVITAYSLVLVSEMVTVLMGVLLGGLAPDVTRNAQYKTVRNVSNLQDKFYAKFVMTVFF